MCTERDEAVGVRGHRTMNLQFQLSAPDYERHENHSDVTCSIYVVHISPEMNGGSNSRQTAILVHPSRPLSLAYLFAFFFYMYCTKNHTTYFHSKFNNNNSYLTKLSIIIAIQTKNKLNKSKAKTKDFRNEKRLPYSVLISRFYLRTTHKTKNTTK